MASARGDGAAASSRSGSGGASSSSALTQENVATYLVVATVAVSLGMSYMYWHLVASYKGVLYAAISLVPIAWMIYVWATRVQLNGSDKTSRVIEVMRSNPAAERLQYEGLVALRFKTRHRIEPEEGDDDDGDVDVGDDTAEAKKRRKKKKKKDKKRREAMERGRDAAASTAAEPMSSSDEDGGSAGGGAAGASEGKRSGTGASALTQRERAVLHSESIVFRYNGLAAMFGGMGRCAGSERVQFTALHVLDNMMCSDRVRKEFVGAGGFSHVVQAMRSHSAVPRVQSVACKLMGTSLDDVDLSEFLPTGHLADVREAIAAVGAAMETCTDDAETQRWGMYALLIIASKPVHLALSGPVAELGLPRVAATMAAFPGDSLVRRFGIMIAAAVLQGDPRNWEAVDTSGVLPHVAEAFEKHGRSDPQVAAFGHQVLTLRKAMEGLSAAVGGDAEAFEAAKEEAAGAVVARRRGGKGNAASAASARAGAGASADGDEAGDAADDGGIAAATKAKSS